MSLLQFSGLFVVWLLCTLFIATLTWFEFRRVRFNFNVFFSLLFLLTFLRAASTRFTTSPTKPAYANALPMYRAVRCLP